MCAHARAHIHSASITEQILRPWLTVSEQGWCGRELHLELSSDVHLEYSRFLCWASQWLTGSGSSWIDLEGNRFQFTDESVNTESVGKEDPLYCLFPQWSSVTLWNEHLETPRREVLLRCRRAKMCISNLSFSHWSSPWGGSYGTHFESFGSSPAWSGSQHVPSPWVMNATPLKSPLWRGTWALRPLSGASLCSSFIASILACQTVVDLAASSVASSGADWVRELGYLLFSSLIVHCQFLLLWASSKEDVGKARRNLI